MDVAVLGDLLARDRRRSQSAIEMPAIDRTLSYHDFITTSYKAGNVLRYLGLGADSTLAVDPSLRPEPLFAFFGAAQLGATTTFDPTASARVRLVPVDAEAAYDDEGRLVVFGGSPEAASTTHWEKAVWSENPAFPPTTVDSESTVLVAGDDEYSHQQLLGMAEQVVDELALERGSRVAVRTPLSRPETIAGGLVASLIAGSTAIFVDDPQLAVDAEVALVADPNQEIPESRRFEISELVD